MALLAVMLDDGALNELSILVHTLVLIALPEVQRTDAVVPSAE